MLAFGRVRDLTDINVSSWIRTGISGFSPFFFCFDFNRLVLLCLEFFQSSIFGFLESSRICHDVGSRNSILCVHVSRATRVFDSSHLV